MSEPALLLEAWSKRRLPPPELSWLLEAQRRAAHEGLNGRFLMAFGAIPRRLGRGDLDLDQAEQASAEAALPGWRAQHWTIDQAARALLVLSLPDTDSDRYEAWLRTLFEDSDLGELVALYQALPLLPHPERHRERAQEGVRTNMKAVFEAIALDNPYPAQHLPDEAFNQLVLKCLFIGSPLHRVHRIDERTNLALARMLCDYARERWAAGRAVSPELWRAVGPVARNGMFDVLRRALETGTESERLAVALSCKDNSGARALFAEYPELFTRVEREPPAWSTLALTRP